MMLKVGELAKRSGLTVRTLHHYDSIGLLTPTARSDTGYRLYQRADIARLHRIQALRRFGMSLSEIGAFLTHPDTPLSGILAQQVTALDRQIEQATRLRDQLTHLQRQLAQGEEPELADWLSTLELMTMYDQYFSKEELSRLPLFQPDRARQSEWQTLVAQVSALKEQGVPPSDPRAQQLSRDWMTMLERDTAGDAGVAQRLNDMMRKEPAMQQQSGITPDLTHYVTAAFGAVRQAIYAKYLDADEMRHMRDNAGKDVEQWPALIAAVQREMDAGSAPADPAVQALARQWFALFRNFAGDRPGTRDKIRLAHEQEPLLMTGTWMNEAMLAFVRASAVSLRTA